MKKVDDIVGEKIGEFTAVDFFGRDSHGIALFTWRCVCGKTIIKSKQAMQRRKNPTCGCESYTKVCPDCHTVFETRVRNQKFCAECRKERIKEQNKRNKQKKSRKRIRFADTSIDTLNREARSRGMTYGQLQAMRYSEAMSWGR